MVAHPAFYALSLPGNQLLLDQRIPVVGSPGAYHPHTVDKYIPSVPIRQVLFVQHGAGGDVKTHLKKLKMFSGSTPTMANVSWGVLAHLGIAVYAIEGFNCDGVYDAQYNPRAVTAVDGQGRKVRAWHNGIMYSGHTAQGDRSAIVDCVAMIRTAHQGARVGFCGHSNGAMWGQLELLTYGSTVFDFFCLASGPPGLPLALNLPATPGGIPPVYCIMGDADTVIGVVQSGGINAGVYTQPREKFSVADVYWPAEVAPPGDPRVGETQWQGIFPAFQHQVDLRNAAKGLGAQTVGAGVTNGTVTTYTASVSGANPSGACVLDIVHGSDHQIDQLQDVGGLTLIPKYAGFGYANAAG
jgi:hypothetical protein